METLFEGEEDIRSEAKQVISLLKVCRKSDREGRPGKNEHALLAPPKGYNQEPL